MKNKYGLPEDILDEIRKRDRKCVYCGVFMIDEPERASDAQYRSVEHLYPPGNDPTWVSFCCQACNRSHKSPLREWFKTAYCIRKNINENTVAEPIKKFLESGLEEYSQIWTDGVDHDFLLSSSTWDPLPGGNGIEFVDKEKLSAKDQVVFAKIAQEIAKHEFTKWYKDRNPEVSIYREYEFWIKGDIMYRRSIKNA